MTLTLASSTSTSPLPEKWVERLFERMLLDYGRKFSEQWGGADTDALIAHWSRELAGYSGAELKRGLEALSTRDWPPTLPEFKKLCRRPMDPMHAYYEAVAGVQARAAGEYGKWSHPAIYWAAMPLAFDLGSQTFSQIKPRWEAALHEQMDKGEWPEIPQPMLALTAPGKSTTSSEKARQAVKEAAGQVMHKFASTDWATKLLARADAGEQLTPTQILFARQALGRA